MRDGGWSSNPNPRADSLSTAFALLALALANEGAMQSDDRQRAERAREALVRLADTRGWQKSDFIKPSAIHRYGSRTITTAMVTKAALAWLHIT